MDKLCSLLEDYFVNGVDSVVLGLANISQNLLNTLSSYDCVVMCNTKTTRVRISYLCKRIVNNIINSRHITN